MTLTCTSYKDWLLKVSHAFRCIVLPVALQDRTFRRSSSSVAETVRKGSSSCNALGYILPC